MQACINVLGGPENYMVVARVDMWEMLIVIFVRSEQARHISVVETASEATGLSIAKKWTGKQLGNKGVAIGFRWYDTPLCFIGSHLAALNALVNAMPTTSKLLKIVNEDGPGPVCGWSEGQGFKSRSTITHVFDIFWMGDLTIA